MDSLTASKPKLVLAPVDHAAGWDELVARSPQGSLFSERAFLALTGRNHHLFTVKQGLETKAGVALVVSDDGLRCELDDFVIYGGILFDLDQNRQPAKRRHDEFQITEFIAGEIASRYSSVAVALSPAFEDLRPFLWYRYHDEDSDKFTLDLRYTSCVDISTLRDCVGREEESSCFSRMETVRRYSVREARRKGGLVRRTSSPERLVGFYRDLMSRQDAPQPEAKLQVMERVMVELLRADRGAVYEVLDVAGTILYAVFYAWDAKRAYYLFGAGRPGTGEPWQGTLAHWEAFKDLSQRLGVMEVDLEGVNSPNRGWFKLGLGGDLRQYYQVRKGKKQVTQ